MKNQAISRFAAHLKAGNAGNERGSVIFIILIAVALFAALSFVIMQSSRSGSSTLTDQQAKLVASEILGYANKIQETVRMLMVNGCSDTEINFESTATGTTYDNTTAPADGSCDVYGQSGGRLRWVEAPEPFKASAPEFYLGKYFIYAGTSWEGVGTTCTSNSCVDLMMGLNDVSRQVCEEINKGVGINGIPGDTEWGGIAFAGTYTYAHALADEPQATNAIAKRTACFSYNGNTQYSFAQVLIAR